MPIATLPGELQMYYEDDNFTDPWTQPDTVILHHGNAKNSQLWYAWVPLLAADYRVIRVEARGFGHSTVPVPGYNWSLEGFATDLVHLMDHLGIDQAHVIGETIGGTIGLQFAYQYPERLRTLTACTSPYRFRGVQSYSTTTISSRSTGWKPGYDRQRIGVWNRGNRIPSTAPGMCSK